MSGNFGPNTQTPCCVPHPEHLLQDAGSQYGPEGTTHDFYCGACQNHFSKSTHGRPSLVGSDTPWTYRPTSCCWCYHGTHTIKPLKASDDRRIMHDTIHLSADDEIQDAIDQLPETVGILSIKSSSGFCDDDINPVFCKRLPHLEELHFMDVMFKEVTLDQKLTPKLERLEMQNVPDECEISIVCPTLKDFEMRYHHGPCEWVDHMLLAATKLEVFRSYKLGVFAICFASNHLREVHLHRSDCVQYVSLWAPRLQFLRLQGCYDLERIDIQSSHGTLAAELPLGMAQSLFRVDTTNSCLSDEVMRTLGTHPRVAWDGPEEDEMAGVGGGMENLFMRMGEGGFHF